MSAELLVGNWQLVSWQVIVGDHGQNSFGPKPRGFLVLTPAGRMFGMTVASDRMAGTGEAERAALHRSMLAYTGKYRVEGDAFITKVDISWNESWNGTEQRRRYRIDRNRLFIDTAPAPSITHPGKIDFRRIIWEREC